MNTNYFRLGAPVERPTQELVLWLTGRTELAPNEEIHYAHYGEDGPGYSVERTREFHIDQQASRFDGMQQWAIEEYCDMLMMADEPDEEQQP